MSTPCLTVCIPFFNRAAQLGPAIRSVLGQDYRDFELLLLDDGSTDDGHAVAASFTDPRVRIASNSRNLGIPASRNRCLDLARGAYIALLDSDDRMAPQRLSRQVALLNRHPDIATVGGWVAVENGAGRTLKRLIKPLAPEQLAPWLLFRCCHANTTVMARTETLRRFRYDEAFPVSEDYDLLVRLAMAGEKARNLPLVLTTQLQHDARITANTKSQGVMLKNRLAVRQLERLGIAATPIDLERHFALSRLRRADVEDPGFMPWACRWLEAIGTANGRERIYDSAGLAAVLGIMWAQACAKSAKVEGRAAALGRYRSSSLSRGVLPAISQNLIAALRR